MTRALPIVIVWAVIWFLVSLIEVFFRAFSRSGERNDIEFNAENVARTIAGVEKLSFAGTLAQLANKGVRMVTFLIFPAIAWERKGLSYAVKKGLTVAMVHKGEFLTGFVLTELAAIVVFAPPGLLFFLSRRFGVAFPDFVWVLTIVYCCFAWSFSIFLEQMFVAELYRWHLRWEEAFTTAQQSGHQPPTLQEVPRPSVLDTLPDLAISIVRAEQQRFQPSGAKTTPSRNQDGDRG